MQCTYSGPLQKELLKCSKPLLNLCFIDYRKAFDTARPEEFITMLQSLDIDGKDLRIIKNLYWYQTGPMSYENEIGQYVKIKQGC